MLTVGLLALEVRLLAPTPLILRPLHRRPNALPDALC